MKSLVSLVIFPLWVLVLIGTVSMYAVAIAGEVLRLVGEKLVEAGENLLSELERMMPWLF